MRKNLRILVHLLLLLFLLSNASIAFASESSITVKGTLAPTETTSSTSSSSSSEEVPTISSTEEITLTTKDNSNLPQLQELLTNYWAGLIGILLLALFFYLYKKKHTK